MVLWIQDVNHFFILKFRGQKNIAVFDLFSVLFPEVVNNQYDKYHQGQSISSNSCI